MSGLCYFYSEIQLIPLPEDEGFLMKQLFFLILSLFCITSFLFPQTHSDSLYIDQKIKYSEVRLIYGETELNCLVFPPADSSVSTGLILIHEEWGLTDWTKSVSSEIANQGYLVIVPDLLSGYGSESDTMNYLVNEDVIRTELLSTKPKQIMPALDECYKYLKVHPLCNGKIAVIGFSWGGTQAFLYLTENNSLSAGFIFYGRSPEEKKELARIQSPVYGIYGEYDTQLNSSLGETLRKMNKLGKVYKPFIIDGGGHGFMRSGERPGATEDNIKARTAGWNKLIELLSEI